ncbi:hypothetical protein HAPG_00005 [Halorubrum phage GNf2]|nr:hypothetical protein HAPG_00005 [Halorubrum phage GNf2]
MALEFYVEQADRSPLSGLADEQIYAGELVTDDGAGVSLLTFGDDLTNFGLARYDAQAMAAETDEDVRGPFYESGQRVQYQPPESAAVVRVRTLEDAGGNAPAITHRDVVGVVDEGDGDAPSGAVGRVVQEGYSNGATTFNRANNNFKALGTAYRPARQNGGTMDEFDYPVRINMFAELKED